MGGGVPSGGRQARQEVEDAQVGVLARGLEKIEEGGVKRKAQAVRAGHVPRLVARLKGSPTVHASDAIGIARTNRNAICRVNVISVVRPKP